MFAKFVCVSMFVLSMLFGIFCLSYGYTGQGFIAGICAGAWLINTLNEFKE